MHGRCSSCATGNEVASAKAERLPGLLAGAWAQAAHTSGKSYYLLKKKSSMSGSVISISKRMGGRSLSLEVAASKRVEKESQKRESSAEITANPTALALLCPLEIQSARKNTSNEE